MAVDVKAQQAAFEAGAHAAGLRRWHWLPIPLFAVAQFALWMADPAFTYLSPRVLLLLNLVFSSLTSLFVAALMVRTFVTRSSPFLLFLGCGVLAWGATGAISIVADPQDINVNVTIFNGGALLAALFNLAGALLSLRPRRLRRIPMVWISAAYAVAVGSVVLVGRLAAEDLLPVFFVQGRGGTPVRQAVLSSAVAMFIAAALVIRVGHRRTLSKFIDWYSIALLLIATGLAGVLVQSSFGGALNWVARSAQYAGGVYMLVAAVTTWRDSEKWEAALEAALTEAARRYEDLFDLATDGIAVHEFGGEPLSGRFTRANTALCRLLGYTPEEMLGLTPRDVTVPESMQGLQPHLMRAALRRDRFLRHDEFLLAKDGRRIPVEMNTRLFIQDGREMVISVIRDMTERRRVEEEREGMISRLDAERALLDMVVNNATEGINLVRAGDMRYVLINPAYQAMFPGREILGRTVSEVWPEVPGLEDLFRQVLETGQPYRAMEEGFHLRPAPDAPPEERFFNWTLTRVRLPGGEDALLNTVSDVTERVGARQQIAATSERLGRVLASITEGYYVLDREWRIREMNAAAQAHFGGADLKGQSIWSVTATGPESPVYQAFQRAVAGGNPVHFEAESSVRPGRWFDMHVYPRDGRLEIYFHDITDRKSAVEAVKESERRYRHLFESMQEGFLLAEVIVDGDGRPAGHRYLEVNAACEIVLGRKREEVTGRTHAELFAGSEWEEWTALFSPVALGGEPARLELQGRGRYYEAFAYRPQPGRFAVLFTDITERKQAEERLRQAQKLESVGLLAGGIAHDFNNLLVGVIGNASLARDALEPGHPAGELLERIQESGEHAAHLTRQMLAYSGKGRFVIESLDLSAMVPEIAALVHPSISRKISIEFHLQSGLPPVEADRGQIQQVVMNLLLNASEAIGAGPGTISVRTGAAEVDPAERRFDVSRPDLRAGRYVFLEVRDSGCGMDQETRARIFDPFFSTKFTGRGLGLAAVAGIIRSHNGAMEVASAPGGGSCFVAWFPTSAARHGEQAPAQPEEVLPPTVLLVEGDPLVREMARRALEYSGMNVLTAEDADAAAETLRREFAAIAVVVLEVGAPGVNSEQAIARIRSIRPGIRVVACSGYGEEETRRMFAGHEISGVVQKPYTAPHLAEAVRAAMA